MKNLKNPVALLSRTGSDAILMSIDVKTKTCIIRNGKEKVVTFATAASYRTNVTGQKARSLSEKVLKVLLEEDKAAQANPENTLFETTIPVADDGSLQYIEDLASALDLQAKSLRKKLRQLESAGLIKKTNHTWCWEPNQFNAILTYLQANKKAPKVEEAEEA